MLLGPKKHWVLKIDIDIDYTEKVQLVMAIKFTRVNSIQTTMIPYMHQTCTSTACGVDDVRYMYDSTQLTDCI